MGCIPVGMIKCYHGVTTGSAFAIGTLVYRACSLIDGIDPNTGHIGQVVRTDQNIWSDVDSDAYTVYSIDPGTAFPNVPVTAPLTTNATCTPVVVDGCTDSLAWNYNPNATIDDGSCIYSPGGCVPVGMIKCYHGVTTGGAGHAVGDLVYRACSLIDGITPNAGHIGQTVRTDQNIWDDWQTDAFTVYSVNPGTAFPNVPATAALTTNATCNPTSTSHLPNGTAYTWDQVKVLQPDGTYKAYIFSPLYYKARTVNAGHTTQYPSQLAEGNFSITRGGMDTMGDNSWLHRVVYLFADEDGKYPIEQKIFPPNYGGTVPDPRMNMGPTEGGPDDPATPNTQLGAYGELFNMWSPGMPMEGVFPEVGDIVKITDLHIDYRDSVWYNTTTPWNHVLPVQDPCPGEYHWIISNNGCGTHMSRNPYQSWAGGVNNYIDWPAGKVTPNQDQLCLQVIAVITETQFNSNDIFVPSQTQPVQAGPAFTGGQSSDTNIHPCYKLGVEGCHYHDRANNTRHGNGDRYNHNTPTVQEGIGHMTLYMKPNPDWSGVYNVGTVEQDIGIQTADCYDVCAYRIPDDNTIPNIGVAPFFSNSIWGEIEMWTPRLSNNEGTASNCPAGTDDCCNIHCPCPRGYQNIGQADPMGTGFHTRGYKVPYDGRYVIRYECELYQAFGGQPWMGSYSEWSAWITINRKIVSWGNNTMHYFDPYDFCWDCGNYNNCGDYILPHVPPFNAVSLDGYCIHWDAGDSNSTFVYGDLEIEIDLKKGDDIQIVFKGENGSFTYTNTTRIRKQYFRVRPKPGTVLVNSVVVQNDIPPPGALCYDVPDTQIWQGNASIWGTGTDHQHNEGIIADPGHDWQCNHKTPTGWAGTTTICESAKKCLRMPTWNCDLSLSYLPVTIDPDGTGEWWRISGQGCIDPGDGSGTYKSFSGNTYSTPSCIEQCNPPWWNCDGNGGCTSASTVAPVNAYLSLAACQANCIVPSWDCDMTQGLCYDPGTGNGQYTSLATCNQYCHATTYNCGSDIAGTPGVCHQSNGPNGQYLTLAACQSNCFPESWDCVIGSCVDPGDGTGVFPLLTTCKDVCSPKEPCSVYLTTISAGVYTEPGGTPVHNICAHDLWFYDITANTTTWVMTLPQQVGSTFQTSLSCAYRNGVANTETKLWTYKEIGNNAGIIEYDIDPTDPTILTHSRDIDILPLGLVTIFNYVNIHFLTAIDNKTLIIGKKNLPSNDTIVINLDIHPVVGPIATDKFVIPFVTSKGDVVYLPSENAIFVSDEGGEIRKYNYTNGTLLSSFNPSHDLDGLFMYQGNIYTTGAFTKAKFLVDKQTCVTTFVGYINIPTPYTTGGIWQSTLYPVVPLNIMLGGTLVGNEVAITNASSSPCCDNDKSNCGACLETLSQYMPSSGVNFVSYAHNMTGVMYGDCVSDPGGCCYCCTYASLQTPLAPPNNSSARQYATTLNYVDGIGKTKEKVEHLEEIKRWFADPTNKSQDIVWNTSYFAKRNNEYEKGECGDDFEAISLFSITITISGESYTFEDSATWSDVIKYSVSLGARVDKSMTWDKYIKIMYSSFGINEFSYSANENSCGCYNDETSGPEAKAKSFPCGINNGNYVDLLGEWRECEVDIHGKDCTGDTMNWGCCGGNMLTSLYLPSICDNRQGVCPSGCAKVDTGYVGYDTNLFFEWYTNVSNGFYAIDIRTIKYILNNLPNQVSYPCYETSVGWWYNFSDQFGVSWTSTTGTVTAHFQSYGTSWFSTWLEFITALFSNNFATINLGVTFNQLLNYPYQLLMDNLQLIQPGFALHIYGSPCKCDGVECVQNVPKPDGYLTKDDCQSSYVINDCPHSDQRCTPDPWRCIKRQIPSQSNIPQYKCYCVQDGGGNYTTITYATEELCEEAENCCLPETYNCKTSESDCVGKNLLPQIVGRWWDGVQATNTITATPVATSTELFSNAIFGLQSIDIRTVRWEYSLLPANTISSWDCMPTSQLSASWVGAPWITVTGIEFKDPFQTTNINNTMGLPGLPVYTWLDYISLLNSYGVGTLITPSMSSGQVGSIIKGYMGWGSITFGITWRRCVCNWLTTSCSCVDPGDGSGTHSSLYGCQTAPLSCCGAPPI